MKEIIKELNWPMISIFAFGTGFWICIFYFGLFQTVMWYIIMCATIGIIVKLRENKY